MLKTEKPENNRKDIPAYVEISEKLKTKLKEVKAYLKLLANPSAAEKKYKGIFAVRDKGKVIQGVLRYSVNIAGPKVVILGGIHMNELSGVWAILQFHKRWLKGIKPEKGDIFVATGNVNRALEFIEIVLKSDSIPKETWADFATTKNNFNYNRIPKEKTDDPDEYRARQIIKNVLSKTNGKVLDIHSTSTNAPPMITIFREKNETPEECKYRINHSRIIKKFPIKKVIIWKPGPFNGMESIRLLGRNSKDCALPLLIETGGGFDYKSFERADLYAQLWLKITLGMQLEMQLPNQSQSYYFETYAFYHPAVMPQDYSYLSKLDFKEAQKDTFILIRDWQSIKNIKGWSSKAKQALKELEPDLSKDRLDNFMPITKGSIIAIGRKTGVVIRIPQDGAVLMARNNPYVKQTLNEAFANLSTKM